MKSGKEKLLQTEEYYPERNGLARKPAGQDSKKQNERGYSKRLPRKPDTKTALAIKPLETSLNAMNPNKERKPLSLDEPLFDTERDDRDNKWLMDGRKSELSSIYVGEGYIRSSGAREHVLRRMVPPLYIPRTKVDREMRNGKK